MARFKYAGRDRQGKKAGVITAESKKQAAAKLAKSGIRVIDLEQLPETLLTKDITIGNPVKLEQMVVFLKQFSTLLHAGVTVVDAVMILAQQTESKGLKKALAGVEAELREGNPLSAAFAKQKKVFEPLFINMVRAGEATGSLDETLEEMAEHYERQYRTRQKVVSALAYPVVVGLIAVGVVIFLLVSVVPTFVTMFDDLGGELPAITKFVIGASDWMQKYWYVLLALALLVGLAVWAVRQRKETKYYLDYFLLRMPVFGNLLQKAALARMTRTLSSLFSNSVPILQALDIVENVVENEVISRVIRSSKDALEKGGSMTEPMKHHWAFPPLIHHMISIGEETGALDSMLAKVADFYEREVEAVTDRLKSLIEPLMIVALAAIVGTIVTSILVPMFEIFNTVQQY